jgi:pimeloyl-ACP methyl ester carboxylesterase
MAICSTPATAQPAAGTAHTVRVNGIDLRYEMHGTGEALVLLHGFTGCGRVWQPFIARLAKEYQVIVPDLRGHGGSTGSDGTFTHRQSAADVLALLDRLGVGRFRAMGISTGGMTLLHAATRQPDRIEAMVLIGASTHFPEQAREIMRGATVKSLPPPVLEEMRRCVTRGEAQVGELVSQFHAFKDSYDDMTFTAPHLATIRARTLIVHGDRDEFFPVDIPVAMYSAIPGSALWIVPGGDHVPIFGERSEAFLATAMKFLRGR